MFHQYSPQLVKNLRRNSNTALRTTLLRLQFNNHVGTYASCTRQNIHYLGIPLPHARDDGYIHELERQRELALADVVGVALDEVGVTSLPEHVVVHVVVLHVLIYGAGFGG